MYIVCDPLDPSATVLTAPKVVIEVVSRDSVERNPLEKRSEYVNIDGLEAYFAFFEHESRVLDYAPYDRREPIEHRETVVVHGVEISISALFIGLA